MSWTNRLHEGVFVMLFGHRDYDNNEEREAGGVLNGAALEKLGGFCFYPRMIPPLLSWRREQG